MARGYFGVGAERISKPMNLGNLFRTAHAFGASFLFTVAAHQKLGLARSDTSSSYKNIPAYQFDDPKDLRLPEGCSLVGVELADQAIDLPRFRHPRCAAYILGPERGSLSDAITARCDFVVRIPTRFCINLATAGAIVIYDRMLSMGRFAERPVTPLSDSPALADHVHGGPKNKRGRT